MGVFEHGQNVLELELMVEYGMDPQQVLVGVTSGNARILQLEKLGRIEKGFLADLVSVRGNPIDSISALYDVQMVMKDGFIFRYEK